MKVYTVHRRGEDLRLIPDGGSFWALVFGPFWLAAHGAWLAALAVAIVELLLRQAAVLPLLGPWAAACEVGMAVAVGMFASDLRRWELAAGGFVAEGVVGGRDRDEALFRLGDRVPAGV